MPKTPPSALRGLKIHIMTLARKNALSAPPGAAQAAASIIISLTDPPTSK